MSFIDGIKNRAKQEIKTIVLPEASDKRVVEAASIALKEKYAKVILLGDENIINNIDYFREFIKELCEEFNIKKSN